MEEGKRAFLFFPVGYAIVVGDLWAMDKKFVFCCAGVDVTMTLYGTS